MKSMASYGPIQTSEILGSALGMAYEDMFLIQSDPFVNTSNKPL